MMMSHCCAAPKEAYLACLKQIYSYSNNASSATIQVQVDVPWWEYYIFMLELIHP
jgi:hypothetical protein